MCQLVKKGLEMAPGELFWATFRAKFDIFLKILAHYMQRKISHTIHQHFLVYVFEKKKNSSSKKQKNGHLGLIGLAFTERPRTRDKDFALRACFKMSYLNLFLAR